MEIIIHGSKRGQQEFYNSNPQIKDVAKDFRSGSAPKAVTEKAIGNELYGLSYSKVGVVFSKIIIILDIPRQGATGFVAFSLILKSKEINAENIKSILDKYEESYFEYYNIIDNKITSVYSDDSNFNKNLLDKLKVEYSNSISTETFAKTNLDYYQSGNKNPAYTYYDSEEDLLSYFNNPFWTEYRKNSMVYLIESKYKDTPENPLNALRHTIEDNLTGIIDNKLKPFELKIEDLKLPYENIEVELNSIPVESGIYFRAQDTLKIKLKKNYFKAKIIEGKWDDVSTYFEGADSVKTLKVDRIEFEPEPKKEVTINIMTDDGIPLDCNFKFNINTFTSFFKEINGKKISVYFEGPQIKEEWRLVYISSDDSLFEYTLKEYVTFIPEKESEITITLTREREIEIKNCDTKSSVTDVKLVLTSEKKEELKNKGGIVEFKGKQIYKDWKIKKYNPKDDSFRIETEKISPFKTDSVIKIKQRKRYTIGLEEDGKELSITGFYYEGESKTKGKNKEFFKEIKKELKEEKAIPKGKKITDYEFNSENIEIVFSEKNKLLNKIFPNKRSILLVAVSVLFLTIGAGGAYFFFGNKKPKINQITTTNDSQEAVTDSVGNHQATSSQDAENNNNDEEVDSLNLDAANEEATLEENNSSDLRNVIEEKTLKDSAKGESTKEKEPVEEDLDNSGKETDKNKTLEQKEEKSKQAKINDSISKESEKGVVKPNEKALENEDLKKKDSIENNSLIEADINKQKN